MLNLDERNRAPDLAFDKTERKIPGSHFQGRCRPVTLRDYINLVARMGGYLARKSDPPPGNTVTWRGFSKLYDVRKGIELADVGN